MSHYDDLQRFKEKTCTQRLRFKDLSSEAADRERGDWPLLQQFSMEEEEPSLAMGGSVSLSLPQQVPADTFRCLEAESVRPAPAVAPTVLVVPTSPAAPTENVETPSAAFTSDSVVEKLAPMIAEPSTAPDRYAHLFAVKTAEQAVKNKDRPLKSLLERIATCR